MIKAKFYSTNSVWILQLTKNDPPVYFYPNGDVHIGLNPNTKINCADAEQEINVNVESNIKGK